MFKIDKDFVYNKFPKTEHDVLLYDKYKAHLTTFCNSVIKSNQADLLRLFPVYEGTKNAEGLFVLTRFGFMALSIDDNFMNTYYKRWCTSLLKNDNISELLDNKKAKLLRASLIEFALLGCLEAHQLLNKLDSQIGQDDSYIESIVNERCPNLKRFLNAHDGAGRGVNEGDEVSSYAQALKEVKAGCKRTHWIWYIFPQMAGIKGTHSRPALFYGINGRYEAYQYINHPVLRNHLVEISEAVLNNKYSAYEIFGNDDIKFRSCILLFASVSDIPVFKQLKSKYRW
jgi:uncharacterized protein (DUF1810 family)